MPATIHDALASQYMDVINRRARNHNIHYQDEVTGALIGAIACLYNALEQDPLALREQVEDAVHHVLAPPKRAA